MNRLMHKAEAMKVKGREQRSSLICPKFVFLSAQRKLTGTEVLALIVYSLLRSKNRKRKVSGLTSPSISIPVILTPVSMVT